MIIGIVGDMGSGKTLLMSYMLYSDFKDGIKIYSNYKLNFQFEYLSPSVIENLFKLKGEKVSFGIDEMHIFLDARSSFSSKNKLISYWILQTRKRGITLYYTTQYYSQVDKRLRNSTDYLIKAYNLGDKNNPILFYSIFKKVDVVGGSENYIELKSFFLKNIKKFFKLYDTTEIINPFNDKDNDKDNDKENDE